jgi:hypothetical protein
MTFSLSLPQKIRIARASRTLIGAACVCALGCDSSKIATPAPQDKKPAPVSEPALPSPRAAVEGTVRVRGKAPSLPPLATSGAVAKVCGLQVADATLKVDEKGGLANAIVYLEGARSDASPGGPPQPAIVDQKQCQYTPPVLALRAGAELEIRNSDPLLHNVHAKNSSSLFNFAMPVQGITVRKQLPRTAAVIHLACDVHPWMQAVIRTFEHPYFALTDAGGHYRLAPVPSGKQKLVFWHQRFGDKAMEIDLRAEQPNRADVEWPASELRL